MNANENKKRWLATNTDKVKAYKIRQKKHVKEWQERNLEKLREYLKTYRLINKEKINERVRRKYQLKKLSKQKESKSRNAD